MKHFIFHIILLALVLTVSPALPWHSLGSGPVLTSDLENILFQCLEGTLLSQSEAQNQDGI